MDQAKAQLFLSLMDTLHDFAGPRLEKIEGGKIVHQVIEDMVLQYMRPEFDQLKTYVRGLDGSYEPLLGFLEKVHKFRNAYGLGNLIVPENIEDTAKYMLMKYYFVHNNYKPIYSARKDTLANIVNNVWQNRKQMYLEHHRYMRDVIQINAGNKTENSGIFSSTSQGRELYEYLCLVFHANSITYVADANGLGKDVLCVPSINHPTMYKGLFDQFDFANTSLNGGAPKKIPNSVASSCIQYEFQEYGLSKSKSEVLSLNNIQVIHAENDIYRLKHDQFIDFTYNTTAKAGVVMFLNALLKLREYIGSERYMTPKEKKILQEELQSQALEVIYGMYRISLSPKDMTDAVKIRNYVHALFDLKRAGDYLAVKACAQANANATDSRKYVFVSNDQLAIMYALMQNVPCILTTLMGRKKDTLFLTIYNIHREKPVQKTQASKLDSVSKTKSRKPTTLSTILTSPKPSTVLPSIKPHIAETPASKSAKDIASGNFVASALQKSFGRKQITYDEFKQIKEAIIAIPDEAQRIRALNTLKTIKSSRRRNPSTMLGGNINANDNDELFVMFFHDAASLGLEFPPHFWIIFRFVFSHIPYEFIRTYREFHPTTLSMSKPDPSPIAGLNMAASIIKPQRMNQPSFMQPPRQSTIKPNPVIKSQMILAAPKTVLKNKMLIGKGEKKS